MTRVIVVAVAQAGSLDRGSFAWRMLRRQAVLRTARLLLRPFIADDAGALHLLAGDRSVANTMISIPHPYSLATAKSWIAAQAQSFGDGSAVHFAVVHAEHDELIGCAGLRDIDREHNQAELNFWIGVPWWGAGFATEAAREIVSFGFRDLGLNRVYAYHMARNPQSGQVLQKIGMQQEGLLRQRVRKWGIYEDVACYAVLVNQPSVQSSERVS